MISPLSVFQEVCSQIWATLYDYPGLKTCDGLIKYIKECVRTAWALTNQVVLETLYKSDNYIVQIVHIPLTALHSLSFSLYEMETRQL